MVINLGRRAALAGATALAASPAIAQSSYPDRPIRMIIASHPADRPISSDAFSHRA